MHDGHDHGGTTTPTSTYGMYLQHGPNFIYNYAYEPHTISVKDGNWFDPATWSNGIPSATSRVQINHKVTISPVTVNGDLNEDGKVDIDDYRDWDRQSLTDIIRFGDVFFGLATPLPGNALAYACLVAESGCLHVANASTLTICTLINLGCFELYSSDLIFCDCEWDFVKDAMQWGHGYLGLGYSKTITRNSFVYSQNPTTNMARGHFAIIHYASLDTEKTNYKHLGRTKIGALNNTQLEADGITAKHVGTNQMARYGGPHLHHCLGDVRIIDCDILNGSKWGITIHQSHFGLYENNRISNCGGAGIAFEDGNEFGNVVRGNSISNIFGDGRGIQGHANGENVKDIGDGTPTNPYRTTGSHGNEGAGIWGRCICNNLIDNEIKDCPHGMNFWSRFQPNDSVLIPASKGERPTVKVLAGGQLDHTFSNNSIADCKVGMNVQGMIDTFELTDHTIINSVIALDTSYNNVLKFVRLNLQNCDGTHKNGFTGRLELFDCTVTACNKGFDIPNDIYVEGGVFETKGTTFVIQLKHVTSGQKSMTLRGPKFTGTGNNVIYLLGDLNKNRAYHAPRDLYCYDWNGVEGDNFQVWMLEQDKDYVPVNNTPHPIRITPEPGITNEVMLDKYLLCLGGRITPSYATTRPKISGKVTPLPVDTEQPQIINHTQVVSPTGVTVKFETTKPTRFRSEWNLGDILWGKYAKLILPVGKEFKTSHEFSIEGLLTGKKYGYIVQVVDEHGNLGGDVRVVNSMRYLERFFTPK